MDDTNTSRHAMVIRADARAMGAVTALNTTHRRKPRLSKALSDTLVTRADGSQYWIARRNNRNAQRRVAQTATREHVAHITAASLPNAAGNITYD